MKMKIVLAYSGGLDTSIIIKWLKDKYNAEVIAFCADLGQNEDMEEIRKKALASGASKAYVENLTDDFVNDYVFQTIKANAIYEGEYMMGTSIARPIIAKKQVEIALKEGAQAVAHGSTGKGNDQVRFEIAFYALAPELQIIAPWKEWEFKSRTDLFDYAEKNGIPVPITREKPYSMDPNLMHISYEGGVLEDPWAEYPDNMFRMVTLPENCPDKVEYVEIEFEKGIPVSINGEKLSGAAMLAKANEIAGRNGIGIVDIVENRFVGMKSRGVYETPGVTLLQKAHRAVEQITMDREVMHIRDEITPKYSELVYNGFWFSPEREMLQAMIDQSQENVNGTARMKLYKGNCTTAGRKSPNSLYREDFATFEADDVYDQYDAKGFIKLNALRLKIKTLVDHKK